VVVVLTIATRLENKSTPKQKLSRPIQKKEAKQILMSEKHIMAGTEREIRIINVELL